MKIKILLCLVWATVGQSIFAQTQQGYVKTLGRPEKRGEALSGVTVRVKGEHNPVVSNQDGTFSLLLADKKNGDGYSLQQVQKNGYELNEKDLIGRQFAFSDKVPLTIVMVSSEQLQADKQRIENNAYKTAEKNYKAKYNLLEMQLSDNEITAEQYREEIADLQDKFEKYQSLIDGLAEHYAHTDYDELDEKDREINLCIENGDLDRADSLIQTLFDPLDVLKRNKEALDDIEHQIGQAQNIIAQANEDMAAVLKQQEKDAEYLYQLYTIALARFDNEKAGDYIETRAELDTINGKWQYDAGYYFYQQKQFTKAEPFFLRALDFYRVGAELYPEDYEYDLANVLEDYALLCDLTQRLSESEEMHFEALEIFRKLEKNDPETYAPIIAYTLINLGSLYEKARLFSESESTYIEAVKIFNELSDENYIQHKDNLAMLLGNLANVYSNTPYLSKANDLYNRAIDIYKELIEEKSKDYEIDLARTQYNLVALYYQQERYKESEALFLESAEVYKKRAKENPQAYEPELAQIYASLASLYSTTEEIPKSIDMLNNSFDIYIRLVEVDSVAYEPDVAELFCLHGNLLYGLNRFSECEESFLDAIDIYERLAEHYPQTYEPRLVAIYRNLAIVYSTTQRLEESEALYHKALDILWWSIKYNPEAYDVDLANTLDELDEFYKEHQRNAEGEALARDALKQYQQLSEVYPEFDMRVADMQTQLGTILIKENKFPQAIASFQEALPYYRERAKNDSYYRNRQTTVLYYLSMLNDETGNNVTAFQINKELIPLMKEGYASDPDSFRKDLVSIMGNQSYDAILIKDFTESEIQAKDALSIDESQHWIVTNLAAALLFQGKYDEAEAIYRQYKEELKESFLQDLNNFETAGVIPEDRKADVERIRQLLTE